MELNEQELYVRLKHSQANQLELYYTVFKLAEQFKPHTVLELGTGWGESGLAFMAAAGSKLTTVDIRKEVIDEAIENFKHFNLIPEKVIHGDDRTPNFVEDRQWDAIFIDTSHLYEHTLAELEYCNNRTKLILMDDFWWGDEKDPGVRKAVQVFIERHPEWISEKPDWSRVGILRKS